MTDYYISSQGDDANAGTAPDSAFKTLFPINALTLAPGDAVLLERGSVFNGQYLHVTGSGTEGSPIRIGAYGDASEPLPAIHADGTGIWHQDYHAPIGGAPHRNKGDVSTALLLKDVPYIEVSDLEISNKRLDDSDGLAYNDLDVMDRTGVAVVAQEIGTVRHTVLRDLFIHDVNGNVYDKHMANGGIYIMAHLPEDPSRQETNIARFDDVRITGNLVRRVNRWGIAVGYTAYLNYIDHGGRDEHGAWDNTFDYGDGTIDEATLETYGATNVVVEGNTVEDCGGDAITTMYCLRPLIRRNVSRRAACQINNDVYTATDNDKVAAAIWPWRCKGALFEYNEAYDTLGAGNGNGDGQAWDADFGDGTVYRYNFSSGNSGGTVMFCNEKAVNSEFCHNVARHDLLGAIDIPRNPDAWVHHNVFIMDERCEPLRLEADRADGTALVEHNAFINDADEQKTTQWHPVQSRVEWRDNLYVNFADGPQEDMP